MTAKEALAISRSNTDTLLSDLLQQIKSRAEMGHIFLSLDYNPRNVSDALYALGYTVSGYSGPDATRFTISWEL